MAKRTTKYTPTGIDDLPNDKPAVYEILTEGGRSNYVGVAKRGRLQGRLGEHLSPGDDYVPGAQVRIQQFDSIAEAREQEAKKIARKRPKHNKQGK